MPREERRRGVRRRLYYSYGGMPYDIAEHSMKTFANEVIPELRNLVPAEDQRIARAGTGAATDPSAFRLMVVAT
jgi:hypothetical protein